MAAHPALGSLYTAGNAAAQSPYAAEGLNQLQNYLAKQSASNDADNDARMQYWLSLRQNRPEGFVFGGMAGAGAFGGRQARGPGAFVPGVRGSARPQWPVQGQGQASPPARPPAPTQAPGPGAFTNPDVQGGQGSFQRNGRWYNKYGYSGTYDPSNPWGASTGNLNPTALGDLYRTVGKFGQGGYMDPGAGMTQAMEGAQGDADALVRRQMSQGQLSGLDPAQAAVAKQQALRETGRGVQDIMAKTRAGIMDRDVAYGRGTLDLLGRAGLGDIASERDFNNAKNLPQKR